MAGKDVSRSLSSEALARALELSRAGLGREAVAARLRAEGLSSASGRTVGRAVNTAEAQGAKLPRPRVGRPRKRASDPAPPKRRAKTPPAPPDRDPDPAELAARLNAMELPDELIAVRMEWLPKMKALADAGLDLVEPVTARDWSKLYLDTAASLIRATPPKPPDPEHDPANIEARNRTRGRLEKLVLRLEAAAAEEAAAAAKTP